MAVRERRLPRTQQPQDVAGVDWGNPLTRGLTHLILPSVAKDLVTGALLTQTGTPSRQYTTSGVTVGGTGSTSNYWSMAVPARTYTRFTILALITAPTTPGFDERLFALGSSTNNSPILALGSGASFSGARLRRWVRDNADGEVGALDTAANVFTTGFVLAALSYDGATLSTYVDGRLDAAHSGAGLSFTVDQLAVGCLLRASPATPINASLALGAVWDRSLDADEHSEISSDPWQLFEPQRIWVPVSAGGGGATESRTVSVSGVGDAAWQATAINAQTIASAGVGAASWQGVAITARQLASDGVAAASWQGGAVVGQTIASAGVAAVAFDGVALAPASLSAAGSAAASWQATSIAAATVASAGQASAAWQSVWVHQQAFSSAGVAAASWVGTDASGGTTIEPRTIASAGVGSATWQASVVAAADLVSDGIGAAAWQAAARVVAAFTSAGSSAFAPESARIDVRTLTAAGVGAAAFDGQDAGTVEARTFSSGGAASVSFAVEGEPERAHGFEIGPATTKPKRRGLVVVDETEEKPARQKITKRDIDRRVFERAREEARAVIAKAAEQHATTQHVKAERFAQVRTALKPLAKALGDWNWIAVYQRMYQQALDEQIRQELAREDAIAAEAQAAEEADERELMNLIMEWM